MKKIIIGIVVFMIQLSFVDALVIDGITITPGKFVERKDLIVSSTYDTEKEELHVFVSAGTMEMDGERYEIKMMILGSDCRIPFAYNKKSWNYSGECTFSKKLEDLSVLRDIDIEIYQYHIKDFRIREQTSMRLNLILNGKEQIIDWNTLKIDVMSEGGEDVGDKRNLNFFLRLENVEHYPVEDYSFEVKIYHPYGYYALVDNDDVVFEYDGENREYSTIISKEFKIYEKYEKYKNYQTDVKIYKMKDNKRPKRSQRVSPVAIINGFENINEIRTFYEENEIPEKKEVIEQQSQKLITKEENIEPFEPKDTETEENKTEENIIENRDVDPKITRTINNFLIKLEKKLGGDGKKFQDTLGKLKESLEKHIVKKPKHKDLIEDIIYLIHKRIEA